MTEILPNEFTNFSELYLDLLPYELQILMLDYFYDDKRDKEKLYYNAKGLLFYKYYILKLIYKNNGFNELLENSNLKHKYHNLIQCCNFAHFSIFNLCYEALYFMKIYHDKIPCSRGPSKKLYIEKLQQFYQGKKIYKLFMLKNYKLNLFILQQCKSICINEFINLLFMGFYNEFNILLNKTIQYDRYDVLLLKYYDLFINGILYDTINISDNFIRFGKITIDPGYIKSIDIIGKIKSIKLKKKVKVNLIINRLKESLFVDSKIFINISNNLKNNHCILLYFYLLECNKYNKLSIEEWILFIDYLEFLKQKCRFIEFTFENIMAINNNTHSLIKNLDKDVIELLKKYNLAETDNYFNSFYDNYFRKKL